MNKIIQVSTLLFCPVHKAFEMFTLNDSLASWLTSIADVEPRPGGKYELFWQPKDLENNSTIGCKITSIVPDKFLSFEWRSPKQYKHFANFTDPLTHVVVFFIPAGDSTEVYLIHSGWRNSAEWEEARQWQEKAWSSAFEQLRKKFESK